MGGAEQVPGPSNQVLRSGPGAEGDTTTNDLLGGPQVASEPQPTEGSSLHADSRSASDPQRLPSEDGVLQPGGGDEASLTQTEVRAAAWEPAGPAGEPGPAIVPQDQTHPEQPAWHDDDAVTDTDSRSHDDTLRLYEPESAVSPLYDDCATETHTAVPLSDSGASETPPPVEPGRGSRSNPSGQVRIRAVAVGLLAFTLAASGAWLALRARAPMDHRVAVPGAESDARVVPIAAPSARVAAPQPKLAAAQEPPVQRLADRNAQPHERGSFGAAAATKPAAAATTPVESARQADGARTGGRGSKRHARASSAPRAARSARAPRAKRRAVASGARGRALATAAGATSAAGWRLERSVPERGSPESRVAPPRSDRRLNLPGSGL